jgi:hypothetical protein
VPDDVQVYSEARPREAIEGILLITSGNMPVTPLAFSNMSSQTRRRK